MESRLEPEAPVEIEVLKKKKRVIKDELYA